MRARRLLSQRRLCPKRARGAAAGRVRPCWRPQILAGREEVSSGFVPYAWRLRRTACMRCTDLRHVSACGQSAWDLVVTACQFRHLRATFCVRPCVHVQNLERRKSSCPHSAFQSRVPACREGEGACEAAGPGAAAPQCHTDHWRVLCTPGAANAQHDRPPAPPWPAVLLIHPRRNAIPDSSSHPHVQSSGVINASEHCGRPVALLAVTAKQ